MPTSGGYEAPAAPPCAYSPRMTRAAALALRTAGTLNENCVVVITDGPTIGNGTTSPTEIELNPVSPTAFGLAARVFTTFPSAAGEAYSGQYDIDLGVAGSIIELRDNFNNVVTDKDADSPTVHTQFPWHLGSATFSGNKVDDSVLTDMGTAVITNFNDNTIIGSTLTFTGMTGTNTWQRNFISAYTINSTGKTGNNTFNDNEFRSGSATLSGGTDSWQLCEFVAHGTITHSGSGGMTLTRTRVAEFFSISHTGTTNVVVDNSRLSGSNSGGTAGLVHSATVGNTSIIDSEIVTGNVLGTVGTVVNEGTAGAGNTVTISNCKLLPRGGGATTIRKQAGSLGSVGLQSSIFRGRCIIDHTSNAVAAGGTQTTIINSDLQESQVINNGGGIIIAQHPVGPVNGGSVLIEAVVQNAVGSTRQLNIYSCTILGGIVQLSVVGGTGSAVVNHCRISGNPGVVLVDIQSTLAGATDVIKNSEVSNGGRVVIASTDVNNLFIENTTVTNGALLTLPAGNSNIKNSRISGTANINTGAFRHTDLVVEGVFTKTLTAANVNRLANKSFDDTI